jgi:F-type H+-transporting ATPase subunit c
MSALTLAGLTLAIAAFACALGIGFLAGKAMEAMGRQPEAAGAIRTSMIIAIAFIEAIALYALVVEVLILYK